jgi:hypothetical protein
MGTLDVNLPIAPEQPVNTSGQQRQLWQTRDLVVASVVSLTAFFGLVVALTIGLIVTSGVDPNDQEAITSQMVSLPFSALPPLLPSEGEGVGG